MTGLTNMITSAFQPSPQVVWDTPPAPESFMPGGSATTDGILASRNNLASMSLDMFSGLAKGVGAIMQGQQQKYAAQASAADQMMQAREETIRGHQQSNQLMDNMIQTIGSQRLAYAANGMDLAFGTPVDVENTTRKLTQNQVGVVDNNAACLRRCSSRVTTRCRAPT